jgi:hypothetical protein
LEKRQHESKANQQPLQKRQQLEKKNLKVAKAGMWQPLEKRLAEEFLKSAGILCKKDAAFLLGKATPSKRGSLWKKGGCLP